MTKFQNSKRAGTHDSVSVIEISDFGFVSDFVLRISDLRIYRPGAGVTSNFIGSSRGFRAWMSARLTR